ncbi:HepT-like ribonuclease domain-containing protein [Paracoccus sp. (in: a-proteobacteria)]|uniref:HepT-like ribonuclease domain-containing protein n=1 Tax=Paracoccus sp. TaxID=267 RepID=UPI0033417FF1
MPYVAALCRCENHILKTQRAVVMCLKIVGEAASRIVADHLDFTQANASIPWRSIRGMRNRIAHGYFDIDLHVVWQTVAELPSLIASLSKISRYPPLVEQLQ